MSIEEIEAKFRRLVNTNAIKHDECLAEALDIINILLNRTNKVLDKISVVQLRITITGSAAISLDDIESDLKGYEKRKY